MTRLQSLPTQIVDICTKVIYNDLTLAITFQRTTVSKIFTLIVHVYSCTDLTAIIITLFLLYKLTFILHKTFGDLVSIDHIICQNIISLLLYICFIFIHMEICCWWPCPNINDQVYIYCLRRPYHVFVVLRFFFLMFGI